MNNNENVSNSAVDSYKASSNLNTAIESPNIDVDSVTGVNIQNNQYAADSSNFGYNNYNSMNNGIQTNEGVTTSNNGITSGMMMNNGNAVDYNASSSSTTVSNNSINYNTSSLGNTVSNDSVNYNTSVSSNDMNSYNQNSSFADNSYNNNSNGSDVSYEPVYEKKAEKNNKNRLIISRELKMLVFIAFLLLLFILLLPYLFGLFNKLILLVTSG